MACARATPPDIRRTPSASSRAVPPKASFVAATASGAPAKLGATPEVEQLIALSKTKLSPEEKRKRLQATLEKFPEHSKEREELIVAGGAIDPPEWTTIVSNYQGRRAEIVVTNDALTILGVRFDVTAEGAQSIADELHAILPTPRILQLIWEQADVRLVPCTLPSDAKMASTARMIEHSKCVDQRIAGRKGLVVNVGKHWVLTNRITEKKNLAANYGWFMKGRRPIEYDFESAPSGFALLALSDDSLREKLAYPPLSPTPAGVHRAYCNDDDGGPRSQCEDGVRYG